MSYQDDIQKILDQALTEKTFSLDVIDRIKALRDSCVSLEDVNKKATERIAWLEKESAEWKTKYDAANGVAAEWSKRSVEVMNREKVADLKEQELKFQTSRGNEIKEMFMHVFRNPTVYRSRSVGHAIPTGNGCYSTTTTSDSETESIQ